MSNGETYNADIFHNTNNCNRTDLKIKNVNSKENEVALWKRKRESRWGEKEVKEGGREGERERKRLLYKIKYSLKFLEKSERRKFHSVPNMISKESWSLSEKSE